MRLVFRRAGQAGSLLLACIATTLIATAVLTGLTDYSREVVDVGSASAVAAAPADERSVLLRGPAGRSVADLDARGDAVRARFAGGLGGLDTRVAAAGYASGRELLDPPGTAALGADGGVLGSVMFLDGLADHAVLRAGAWPRPGARPVEAAIAEPAAAALGARVGSRLPVLDRLSGARSEIAVTGIWRPRDPTAAYWLLAPDAATGVAAQSATYGPIVVPRADFVRGFLASASAAWLVEPALRGAAPGQLTAAGRQAASLPETLPAELGFGTSAVATTRIDRLAERLTRADLVGRSALVTPMLLMVVLGGYALLLLAMLLTEDRRGETALLRARGAARGQLAALAAREAALVVLPAVAVAPLLVAAALRYADRLPPLAGTGVQVGARLDALTWLVAAVAAGGCVLAVLTPALRRGGTYVAELGARSRRPKWAAAQRAGLDLALVGVALLGWYQLRQYSSPLAGARLGGGVGIDPLLAAAPTLGVAAGAVLALRLLPPLTRLAERHVDRRSWPAAMLGMWQAGRRPQGGPVLLVALAVGVSTLAWCLVATAGRSIADQADHRVGADLRIVEASRYAPADRPAQLADVPGVAAALPVWRDSPRLGPQEQPASVVALDAGAADGVVRLRGDLAGGAAQAPFTALTRARVGAAMVDLPRGARRLTGVVTTRTRQVLTIPQVRTQVVFGLPGGGYQAVPLGASDNAGPLRFAVDVPTFPATARVAGFLVATSAPPGVAVDWQLTDLRVDGAPVDLAGAGPWQGRDRLGEPAKAQLTDAGLTMAHGTSEMTARALSVELGVVVAPRPAAGPVPVVATPQALSALRLAVGDRTRLPLVQGEVDVRVAGTVVAVPGGTEPAALLVDLPSVATTLFHRYGIVRAPQEWWLRTRPGGHAVATRALTGVRGAEVLDRRSSAATAARDPYGVGARAALFAAALGAAVIAAMAVAVAARATARRRAAELAVLRALGAGGRLVTRSLVVEQGFLAGVGVLAGLVVGVGVARAMAPLVILTPAADRPVPEPVLAVAWGPVAATAGGLFLLALALAAMVATTTRRPLLGALVRSGADE